MRWLARLLAAIGVATAILGSGLGVTYLGADTLRDASRHEGLPEIELRPLAQRSEILAADGSLLAALYEEDRVPVPLRAVPHVLRDAVVAVEDSAFFEHQGVSVRGLVRAMRTNVSSGDVAAGGSTITQQLVKNSILTSERSYDRKAKEAVLAVRMERELSKQEILENYLNTVYFGQGAYGVHAAARRFFDKELAAITLPEAALLAGMISSPQSYDPIRHPEDAAARRTHVLRRMVREGLITAADATAAEATPLPTAVAKDVPQPTDHFTEEVRRQLFADERLGKTAAEREATIFRGGIKVHTTLDRATQAVAEQAVRERLPESPFTAALVAIDPGDGAVKALVGGPNFAEAKYNLATQGARQAGSSFKTIALAAWLAAGRTPEDLVDATAPCSFPMPNSDPPAWNVDNYDGGSGQVLVTTLREATIKSSNCAYARLSLALGPDKIVEMAKRLGLRHDLPAVPSIVLGSAEVSPLEMASVYATLAADGIRRPPVFIRRVEGPDGKVLLENAPAEERILEPQVARTITDVLRGVVERGTGRKAAIGRPAAGKTGTAQEWRDAWFAGYTPQLAAAVWMGSPNGQESMIGVAGTNVTGGSFPAQIWSQFMAGAMAPLEVKEFDPVDVAAWPPNAWIGGAPAVLPPGFVLPPHLLAEQQAAYYAAVAAATAAGTPVPPPPPGVPPAPPPPPPEATTTTTTTTTAAPKPTTTTTERPRKRD